MNLGRIQQLLIIILVLILLVLIYVIFKELKFYLVPLTIAAFLAMLMLPLNRWLEKKRLPRMLAILISLLIILTVIGVVSFVFTSQIISFTKDIPEFREQILVKFQQLQEFVEKKTGMSTDKQVTILHNEVDSLMFIADALFHEVTSPAFKIRSAKIFTFGAMHESSLDGGACSVCDSFFNSNSKHSPHTPRALTGAASLKYFLPQFLQIAITTP